ncbi:MAG: OsmC family peroxiredoxin [Bacteroidetes bacterium]|nr:MAG: OsmC family peroxiredoxin [Bacteroidota bacterium]
MKTITHWQNDLAFDTQFEGHTVNMNGGSDAAGLRLGFSPKAMLLSGLAGCSGIDVVEILHKMKVEFSNFSITVEAEQTEEHPKVFLDIMVVYAIKTAPENLDKVQRAVNLSLEKYCGVSAMLKKNSAIHASVKLVD